MTVKTLSLVLALSMTCVVAAEDGESYDFKIKVMEEQPTMTMRFKVEAVPEKLSAEYGRVLPAIYAHVIQKGGKVKGSVFGRFHAYTDDVFEVEAGVQVEKTVAPTDKIKASRLPGGRVVTTIHRGDYKTLSKAHDALATWLKQNGETAKGGPWEIYITDPTVEKDPKKWETRIVQPLEEPKKK